MAMDDPSTHTHAYRASRGMVIAVVVASVSVHALLFGLAFKAWQATGTPRVTIGRSQAVLMPAARREAVVPAKQAAEVPERTRKKSVKRADRPDSVRPASLSTRRA
jgi:hypothetical protein